MGSLTSSPDLPAPQPQQRVIQQPAPQPTASQALNATNGSTGLSAPEDDTAGADQNQDQSANSPDGGSDNSAGAGTDPDSDAEQQRAAALLRERNGRESTINTGFRGVLEPRETEPRRKTLLGG